MNENDFKNKLHEDAKELPAISSTLNSQISAFVINHKDGSIDDGIQSTNRFGLYLMTAVIILSFSLWAIVSYTSQKSVETEIKTMRADYEELFVKASSINFKFPLLKTPAVNFKVPDQLSGAAVVAFLNDKNNNPYEKEMQSLAKLSKRITANFSDELLLSSLRNK